MFKKYMCTLCLIAFAPLLLNASWVIKTKQANLRSNPNRNAKVITQLSKGETVNLISFYKSWAKVKTKDQYTGWVSVTVLEELKDQVQTGWIQGASATSQTANSSLSSPAIIVLGDNASSESVNPCQDPKYLKLKNINIDDLSDNEYDTFIKKDDACYAYKKKLETTSTPKVVTTANTSSSQENKKSFSEYVEKNKKNKSNESQRRRIIGGHIFPDTVLFPSLVPSAKFGFAEGFAMIKGEYQSILVDDNSGKVLFPSHNLNYFGLIQNLNSEIIMNDNIALDLNADLTLSGGMEDKNIVGATVEPSGDIRLGAIITAYKSEEPGLLVTFSPRLYYSKTISVSLQNGFGAMINSFNKTLKDLNIKATLDDINNFNDVAKAISDMYEILTSAGLSDDVAFDYITDAASQVTKGIMTTTTDFGLAPSVGMAYAISENFGVQCSLEYLRIKEKEESKADITSEDTLSQFNYNLAISADLRNAISFPLGAMLEYSREGGDIPINNYGLGLYYQGIGDVQLGLFFNKSTIKTTGANFTQKFIQFTITYFF